MKGEDFHIGRSNIQKIDNYDRVILVGAPQTEKRKILKQHLKCEEIETPDELFQREREKILIGDFYIFFNHYLEAEAHEKEKIKKAIQEAERVVLVTTWHRLWWIIKIRETREEFKEFIGNFNEWNGLSFTVGEEEARSWLHEALEKIIPDRVEETVDDTIKRIKSHPYRFYLQKKLKSLDKENRKEVEEILRTLFSKDVIKSGWRRGYVYESIPILLLLDAIKIKNVERLLKELEVKHLIIGRFLSETTAEYSLGLLIKGIEESIKNIPDTLRRVFGEPREGILQSIISNPGTLLAAGTAAHVPNAAVFPALALVWMALRIREIRRQEESGRDSFEILFREDIPEVCLEKVEEKWDLPPMSLQTARRILRGEGIKKMEEALKKLEKHAGEVEELKKSIDDIDEKIRKVDETFSQIAGLYQLIIDNAIQEIDSMIDNVREYNKNIFKAAIEPVWLEDELKKYLRQVKNGRFTVIKGPAGAGKTTLAWKIGDRLKEEGYSVYVPIKNIEAIEEKLKQEALQNERVVFITEYPDILLKGRRVYGASVEPANLIIMLLNNLCQSIIIVCRSEDFQDFKSTLENLTRNVGGIQEEIRSILHKMEEIELKGLDEKLIERVISQIREFSEEDVQRIKEASKLNGRYNPLLALVAADLVKQGKSVENLRGYELIWEKIKPVIRECYESRDWEGIELLLLTGGMAIEDMRRLMGVEGAARVEERLAGYLIKREGFLRIMPPMFHETIFWKVFIEEELLPEGGRSLEGKKERLKRLMQRLRGCPRYYYPMVARNLTIAYQNASREEDRRVVEALGDVLALEAQELEPEGYASCIDILVFGGVALSPGGIDAQKLAEGAHVPAVRMARALERAGVRTEPVPELALSNILSKLLANHAAASREPGQTLESLQDILNAIIEKLTEKEADPEVFMENVYSMAISMLADRWKPRDARDWIEEIEKRALQISHSQKLREAMKKTTKEEPNPEVFMVNVYSMAIFRLAQRWKPRDAKDWIEEIEKRIWAASRRFSEGFASYTFTAIMYHFNNTQEISEKRLRWHIFYAGRGIISHSLRVKKYDIAKEFIIHTARLIGCYRSVEDVDILAEALTDSREKMPEESYKEIIREVYRFFAQSDRRLADAWVKKFPEVIESCE